MANRLETERHWRFVGREVGRAFTSAGADTRAGLRLRRTFLDAGLPDPRMTVGARVEGGPDAPIDDQVAMVTHSLVAVWERTGLATAEEIDVETLADRLRDEAVALGATLVSPSLVSAWSATEA